MSEIAIAIIIVALLVLLVGYTFVSQSLEKRRKRRNRLLLALKHRKRNFKFMVTGFPRGFLTKELTLIVYRALLDACEHLSRLEPKDASHMEDFTAFSAELEQIKQQEQAQRARIENPEQVGEIKQLLEELYRFIAHQGERGNLSEAQSQVYQDQIKRLALQASVDAYAANARLAQGAGKPRLALHYYSLAKKLLLGENGGQGYQKQLSQLQEIIGKLKSQVDQQPETPQQAGPAPEEKKEWEEFSKKEEGWKKKQLYD